MADFLSKPPATATEGERSFYNRIESVFSEENHVLVYFEPEIGGKRPDFLLLSPKYGIIIIEIKDYLEDYLKSISPTGDWEQLKNNEIKRIENPFDQIYQYWRLIQDRLNRCQLPNNVQAPITRIIIFSNIPKYSYIAKKIRECAPSKIQLGFKETLTRNENFLEFITDILPFNLDINKEIFDTIRANIIPTCRLPSIKQKDLLKYFSHEDKVKILDQEQEKLAREMGEGHRLIFGVAGSGKTVILIARARILAKRHPDWKILILCYNRLLKELLFSLLNPQDFDADITINTFHGWARSYIMNSTVYFSSLYQKAEKSAEKED
ncbi:MAG: NERD domain-containing protein, partial [Candidatus Hermodarchaeota archaeon]